VPDLVVPDISEVAIDVGGVGDPNVHRLALRRLRSDANRRQVAVAERPAGWPVVAAEVDLIRTDYWRR
jgi:hypothetical protein